MSSCPLCKTDIQEQILQGRTVALDVGHGWNTSPKWDAGAEGNGLTEYELNRAVAYRTKQLLEALGARVPVFDYHDPSIRLTLRQKGARAGEVKADVFVSVHHNAFNSHAQGTETLIETSATAEDVRLATRIHAQLIDQIELRDRGIKRQDLSVLRGCPTSIPAVLTEGYFIDYSSFGGSIPPEYSERYSLGLALGIRDYLLRN
ncbi:MAG: N-acetylmuramoyl-L-alanine amidase [Candidatus Nanopelagicales bacterium]